MSEQKQWLFPLVWGKEKVSILLGTNEQQKFREKPGTIRQLTFLIHYGIYEFVMSTSMVYEGSD